VYLVRDWARLASAGLFAVLGADGPDSTDVVRITRNVQGSSGLEANHRSDEAVIGD